MNKTWRMSFRCGNRGAKMWPQCLAHGVAAITYDPIQTTDLSRYPQGQPEKLWARLAPAQKASLKRLAYEMTAGDTIYVKEGKFIIGRGTVLGTYAYDKANRIRDPFGSYWNQQVPVDWESNFPRIPILLGAEQFTVTPLTPEQATRLQRETQEINAQIEASEVMEGELITAEATFRKRNRTVIAAKKALSDGLCEACRFSFPVRYRTLKDCLVAHHKNPIGARTGSSRTTVDDILLLCPNCHAVAHTKEPPLSLDELKTTIR